MAESAWRGLAVARDAPAGRGHRLPDTYVVRPEFREADLQHAGVARQVFAGPPCRAASLQRRAVILCMASLRLCLGLRGQKRDSQRSLIFSGRGAMRKSSTHRFNAIRIGPWTLLVSCCGCRFAESGSSAFVGSVSLNLTKGLHSELSTCT